MDTETSGQSFLISLSKNSSLGTLSIEKDKEQTYVHLEETSGLKPKLAELRQKFDDDKAPGNIKMSVITGLSLYKEGNVMLYHLDGATGLDKEEVSKLDASDLSPGTGILLILHEKRAVAQVQEIVSLQPHDLAEHLDHFKQLDYDEVDFKTRLGEVYQVNADALISVDQNRIVTVESAQKEGELLNVRVEQNLFSFKFPPDVRLEINEGSKLVLRLKNPRRLFTGDNIEGIYLIDKVLASRPKDK